MNSRSTLPPSVRHFEARQRAYQRRRALRRLRRSLASSETWAMMALVGVVLVLLLWLTTHALDALTDPVQAALDLVRLGPKSRH